MKDESRISFEGAAIFVLMAALIIFIIAGIILVPRDMRTGVYPRIWDLQRRIIELENNFDEHTHRYYDGKIRDAR